MGLTGAGYTLMLADQGAARGIMRFNDEAGPTKLFNLDERKQVLTTRSGQRAGDCLAELPWPYMFSAQPHQRGTTSTASVRVRASCKAATCERRQQRASLCLGRFVQACSLGLSL